MTPDEPKRSARLAHAAALGAALLTLASVPARAVPIEGDRENVDRFARLHALHLPIVHDGPQGLARSLDLQHIPFTVVLDRNGDVAYTSSHTDDAGLEALAATTRQLAARQPLATGIHEGDQP